MLACENLLMSFRNEEQLLNVIFRIGETWSADNVTDELSNMLRAVNKGEGLTEEVAVKKLVPVSQGVLADAVLKAINENVRGIYDICGSEAITGAELYNRLAEKMQAQIGRLPETKPRGGAPACRKETLSARPRKGGVHRCGVGLEKGIGKRHHQPAQTAWRIL